MKKFVSRDEKLERAIKTRGSRAVKSDSTREWEHFPNDADVGIRVWGQFLDVRALTSAAVAPAYLLSLRKNR